MPPGPYSNPWRTVVLRELKAGRISLAEASRIAAVSPRRITQWCAELGIDAGLARDRWLAVLYAREYLKMARRDFTKLRQRGKETEHKGVLPPFMAPLLPARVPRKGPSKAELRALADQAVIDFKARAAQLKRGKGRKPPWE